MKISLNSNQDKEADLKKSNGAFADFFLHASDEEKKRVFTEAVQRANEDQRALVERVDKLYPKTT